MDDAISPILSSPASALGGATAERLEELASDLGALVSSGDLTWGHLEVVAGRLSMLAQTLVQAKRDFAPLEAISSRAPSIVSSLEQLQKNNTFVN
jgi:hypothetical protein